MSLTLCKKVAAHLRPSAYDNNHNVLQQGASSHLKSESVTSICGIKTV